jgi:hypothetical protein
MLAESTIERGVRLGVDSFPTLWLHGRAGVLGEVDADVVAAAVGFVAPTMVRNLWEDNAPEGLSPAERTKEYVGACARWAERAFADVPTADLQRITELTARVVLSADASLGVLFAGWRRLELPVDPAGAAAVALNVLREMRGGAHLIAVHAVGLGPHGAIVSSDDPVRGGVSGAVRYGWGEPHPVADPEKRASAEMLTTLIASHPLDVLTETERAEFVELITGLRARF